MQATLRLVGSGCGGVAEMRDSVDASAVRWGLCCFDLGAGAFRRRKVLFLHVNGESCPALARGRINGHTAEVQRLIRGTGDCFHASLEVTKISEVTAEEILVRIRHIFVTDNDLADYSMEAMLRDYEAQILTATSFIQEDAPEGPRESAQEVDEATLKTETRCCVPESTCTMTTGRAALRSVADPDGAWNWVLLGTDPEKLSLIAGGGGFIEEMCECMSLHQDTVLFGLLRVVFGTGKLKRIKHVFVHAIGEKTPAVRRGRLNSSRPRMRQVLAEFAECSLNVEVSRCIDFTKELVIEKARLAGVVDESLLSIHEDVSRSISFVENAVHRNAVSQQETRAASLQASNVESTEPPTTADVTPSNALRSIQDVAEVVRLVCSASSSLNWALFGPTEELLRTPSSSVSPAASPFSSPVSTPAASPSHTPRAPWRVPSTPDLSLHGGKVAASPFATPRRSMVVLSSSKQVTSSYKPPRPHSGSRGAMREGVFTTPRPRRLSRGGA